MAAAMEDSYFGNDLEAILPAVHVCFNRSLNADLVLPRFAHALIS